MITQEMIDQVMDAVRRYSTGQLWISWEYREHPGRTTISETPTAVVWFNVVTGSGKGFDASFEARERYWSSPEIWERFIAGVKEKIDFAFEWGRSGGSEVRCEQS